MLEAPVARQFMGTCKSYRSYVINIKRKGIDVLHLEEHKLIKYLAISVGFAICVARISTALGSIATGVSLLMAFLLWYNYNESFSLSKEIKGYMKAYGIFVLLLIPSIVFSSNPVASLKDFLNFWIWRYVVFVIIAAFIHRRDYLVNMLMAFLAVNSAECLYMLVEVLQHVRPDGRGYGFEAGKGLSIAGILCMILPITLVILMDPRFEKKLKKLSSFTVISILIGLLCNKSRGSWLTELIVVPIVTFRYFKQNIKYLAVVLAVFIGITAFMASSPKYVQRVKSITNTSTNTSNTSRIAVWKAAQTMIRDHPVTGVGVGRFDELHKGKYNSKYYVYKKYKFRYKYKGKYKYKYKYKRVKVRSKLEHAHNNVLHITAESGIIGLAGLLYFVGYYLCSSLHNYQKHKNPYDILVFSTCFGYIFLFGLTDYSLGLSTGICIMWFLLAVLLKMKETEGNHL